MDSALTELREGVKVKLSSSHCSKEGVIVMCSENRRSLMVDLRGDGIPLGRGVLLGFMPLLYDEELAGYRDLVTQSSIAVEVLP